MNRPTEEHPIPRTRRRTFAGYAATARVVSELERARALDVDDVAASIREIGFECTRCGAT
jgi:hypothetical protein